MADVKQTNLGLLLGEIDPLAPDLLTLLGDTRDMDAITDSHIQEILEKLAVKDFAEFERKFQPKLYGMFDAETQEMMFLRRKPESMPDEYFTEYPLHSRSPTVSVLFDMLRARGRQGAMHYQFSYEALAKLLSPAEQQKRIRQARKELMHNLEKHEDLLDGDPVKDDIATNLNNLMAEVRENYQNPMSMLALAADDCDQRLLLGQAATEDARKAKIVAGVMNFADDGTLQVLAAPKPDETALALTEGETSKALATILEEDYEDTAGDSANNYMKSLVVRAFSPLSTTTGELDVAKEVENRNAYLQMYTNAQESFIKEAKSIIELLIGVFVYFDQYDSVVRTRGGMHPALIVANCDPEMMSQSHMLTRVQTFLNSTNDLNDYTYNIWHALFPNLSFSSADHSKKVKEIFKVNKTRKNLDVYSIECLSTLVSTFADYDIQTFFAFETGEDTTFDKVKKEGIEAFKDKCEPLMDKNYSAFAIPCLPNVTVVPREKSGVQTGKLMVTDGENVALSKEKEDIQRFYLHGIYVPACFVAGGLMAAMQSPDYLREVFKKNVDFELPGCRVDIESGNYALMAHTTLAREISGYPAVVKQQINNNSFGFILASEKQSLRGQDIPYLTVYKARSLAFDGRQYEPIYQAKVIAYFQKVLKQATRDNKLENVKFFFSANPQSQMSQWMEKKEYLNAIIRAGDEVTYEIDPDGENCDIQFNFDGVATNVRVQFERRSKRAMA